MTSRSISLAVAVALTGLTLAACGTPAGQSESAATPAAPQTSAPQSSPAATPTTGEHDSPSPTGGHGAHDHPADGGPPPAGIAPATDPTYDTGETVTLTADHMPGMEGAEATVSGAFDTVAYSVSYTPTTGGEPVVDHKWVVHEELRDPGDAPLAPGDTAALTAEHMPGMEGAEATIDSATDETVYMVDIETPEMTQTRHKWVVESEMQPT